MDIRLVPLTEDDREQISDFTKQLDIDALYAYIEACLRIRKKLTGR